MDNLENEQIPQMAIGEDQVRKASEILKKYKDKKVSLENKIIENEKWWQLKQWDVLKNEDNKEDPKPASAWLFNGIISKHADYMDAFPTSDILPREEGDIEEAKRLSSIIPVVMAQNEYKNVYSEETYYKLKNGTGAYGVFWDKSKLNGLGDISIKCIDLLSLFWEPGVKNIQDSKNLFYVELVDTDTLKQMYPDFQNLITNSGDSVVKKYMYDDTIDTSNKSAVIDWYYKKVINGKTTLQYVKYVNEVVLYATENQTNIPTQQVNQPVLDNDGRAMLDDGGNAITQSVSVPTGEAPMAQRGLYDHAMYPFVFDVLFPRAGTPVGFGLIEVSKNPQASIDIYNNAFEKNVQYCCSPRYVVRGDGGINEEEFANPSKLIVHTEGNLGEDSFAPINIPALVNSNYISILDNKIQEMKETSGNRDSTTGGTVSGVTAASAIAAMQEAAGKTSRDQISGSYEAHKKVVNFVIELIRQFYSMPRQFRIIGQKGQQEFTSYTNTGLQPQNQGNEFGVDMGFRLPVFDIDVKAERESAYTQRSQNELALEFYGKGFFNPQQSDQVLTCLDMMEFQGKEKVIEKVEKNGGLYKQMAQLMQQMQKMAQMIDELNGSDGEMTNAVTDMINEQLGQSSPAVSGSSKVNLDGGESAITANAREKANNATKPR